MASLAQVAMRSFDLARSGSNIAETILTAAAVKQRGIVKLHTLRVTGDARGCEAQPLVVTLNGRSVAILATMGNVIQAFDIETGVSLWRIGPDVIGRPIKGTKDIDAWLINDNWGILSTPVIDLVTLKLYACAWSSPDASVAKSAFALLEVDLRAGKVMRRCSLQNAIYSPGNGLPLQHFDSAKRKQRGALTLFDGMVHIPFGTIAETAATAQGWMIGVDIEAMLVTCAWASTCVGYGGGMWNPEGPLVNSAGELIFATGNGDFNGTSDLSQCAVKLAVVDGQYKAIDWWSPFSDEEREGGNAVDTDPMPSNYRAIDAWGDQDLLGVTLMEDIDLVILFGKDGVFYPIVHSNFGKTMPADFANKAENYGKLKAPAIFGTFPGFGYDPMPQDARELNFYYQGKSHHQHAALTRWGEWVFCGGENSCIKVYNVGSDGNLTWVADGAETASPSCVEPPGGMPGWMTTLSANGSKDGILWAVAPYGNSNMELTNGRLIAYDASNFASGTLKKLWDSELLVNVFVQNKFGQPIAVNGFVLLPTYDGTIIVYGLA